MEYFKLIQNRYSVRAYKPDPVDDKKLAKILEAARLAPTASNRQPFRLIITKTAGKVEELKKVYKGAWFVQAPLVICACGVANEAWVRVDGKNYLDVDVAIVVDHLILAARNEGLGTCWIAAFNQLAAREFFALPDDIEPIILTPLGYPADMPPIKQRKPIDQLVYYEQWGGTHPG
jgi:nitroreductase